MRFTPCAQSHWIKDKYQIVKTDGLKAMVINLPNTKKELSHCKFWGAGNVSQWGDEFLDVLRNNRGAVDLERGLGRL